MGVQPFSVIVADPPWTFSDKLSMSKVKRGAEAQYDGHVLDVDAIADLFAGPNWDLIAENANLLLWVPGSLIKSGIKVAEAWGFKVCGVYPWVKTAKFPRKSPRTGKFNFEITKPEDVPLAFGMGHTWRHCSEIALDCRKGGIVSLCENKSQRAACLAPNLKHSAKPEAPQDSLEIMFPESSGHRHLELFARRERPGWVCLGNEIDGLDIREALDRLRFPLKLRRETSKREQKNKEG